MNRCTRPRQRRTTSALSSTRVLAEGSFTFPFPPKSRPSRAVAALSLFLSCLFLAGCSVLFVAPYDSVTDQSITDLHTHTIVFLDRMQRTGGTYDANRSFYEEAHGTIAAIKIRAAMLPKNEGTLKNLTELDDQFTRLAALHRLRPLTGTGPTDPAQIARDLLESSFRSLTQIELHKKLGAALAAAPDQKPAS